MLERALEEEVADYLGRARYEQARGISSEYDGITQDLPILAFESAADLRRWLEVKSRYLNRDVAPHLQGWSKGSCVTFLEVLDEGLCFGWSESMRRRCDDLSNLQRFTPRRAAGTAS